MSNTTDTTNTTANNATNTTNTTNNINLPSGGSIIKSLNNEPLTITSKTTFLDQFRTLLSGLENNEVEAEDALLAYYQAQFDLEEVKAATMVNIEQILADMGVQKATVDYKSSVVDKLTMEEKKSYFNSKIAKEVAEMRLVNRVTMLKALAQVIASL